MDRASQKRTSVPVHSVQKYKPGPGKVANVRSKAKASQGAALSTQSRDRQKKRPTPLQDSLEEAVGAAMLTEGRAAPGLKKRHKSAEDDGEGEGEGESEVEGEEEEESEEEEEDGEDEEDEEEKDDDKSAEGGGGEEEEAEEEEDDEEEEVMLSGAQKLKAGRKEGVVVGKSASKKARPAKLQVPRIKNCDQNHFDSH